MPPPSPKKAARFPRDQMRGKSKEERARRTKEGRAEQPSALRDIVPVGQQVRHRPPEAWPDAARQPLTRWPRAEMWPAASICGGGVRARGSELPAGETP